jgi:hypothetical protein
MTIQNLPRLGDMLAIPFFLWLVIYFYKKENKTDEKKILGLFCLGGLIAYIFFVFFLK